MIEIDPDMRCWPCTCGAQTAERHTTCRWCGAERRPDAPTYPVPFVRPYSAEPEPAGERRTEQP